MGTYSGPEEVGMDGIGKRAHPRFGLAPRLI